MACGVPVACSNRKALPEIAGDAALLFDPLDAENMADSVYRILRDTSLRTDLIARGRKRASQFSWDKTAERTLEIYDSMMRR
jgi:glycosyltransferase involved in cell wall biosynthesis